MSYKFSKIFAPQYGNIIVHLMYVTNEAGQISLMAAPVNVNENVTESVFKYSVDQIDQVIIDTLKQFPFVEIENEVQFIDACNNVARLSRRGVANHCYNNICWYQNVGRMIREEFRYSDSPLVVVTDGVRYGVVKHPCFDKMGFVASHIPATDRNNQLNIID